MKNLMYSIAAIAIFSLSSFTTINEPVKANKEDFKTVSCKWRTVYTHSNRDVSNTQWTYGNCNVSEDGTLHPIT